MNYSIDTTRATIAIEHDGGVKDVPLYSTEGFELLSDLWLKVGWNQKHSYTFTWMGIPVIQEPEDLVRMQEILHTLRPDVIVETGVAHGGSLIFYASLLKAIGKGRVIGIDIDIRAHNRAAIEAHPLFDRITLYEGSSTDDALVAQVREDVGDAETVLVILDSNHTREHVTAELEKYAPLVSVGSYLVAFDGIMAAVADTPRGTPSWDEDNPITAVEDFAAKHPEFVIEQPTWRFNESDLERNITYAPRGFLRRVS
jgi:cephalosporin hydroxylase